MTATTSIITTATDAIELEAVPTEAALIEAYLAEIDGTEATKRTYAAGLRKYTAWLEETGRGLLTVNRADILAYRDGLEAAGLKAGTVNTYLAAARSFYRWTEAYGIFPNVAAGVRGLKACATGAKDALTVEQARKVVAVEGDRLKDLRDRAILELMARRGLRTCEIARASIGDLRQIGGRAVLFVQGKGHAEADAFVVLGEECLEPIRAYLEARGESDPAAPLFASVSNRNLGGRLTARSVSRIVAERLEACGLKSARLTAHSLRHTAVTFALLGGATLQEAQAMARHANVETTLIYAHNIDRLEAGGERAVDNFFSTGQRRRAA